MVRFASKGVCSAASTWGVTSREVREPDGSTFRLTARPGVRNRSRTGEDCVGSADSLSELVRFDEEEWDSGLYHDLFARIDTVCTTHL